MRLSLAQRGWKKSVSESERYMFKQNGEIKVRLCVIERTADVNR